MQFNFEISLFSLWNSLIVTLRNNIIDFFLVHEMKTIIFFTNAPSRKDVHYSIDRPFVVVTPLQPEQ